MGDCTGIVKCQRDMNGGFQLIFGGISAVRMIGESLYVRWAPICERGSLRFMARYLYMYTGT